MTTALLRETAVTLYIHHTTKRCQTGIYSFGRICRFVIIEGTYLLINLPSDLVPMHVPVPNNPDSNQVSPPSPPLPVQIRVDE